MSTADSVDLLQAPQYMRQPLTIPILSGPAMVLGALPRAVTLLPRLAEFFRAQRLPPNPALLGMDRYFAAAPSETVWTMATEAAQHCLNRAGVVAGDIGALILCGATLAASMHESTPALASMMCTLGLTPTQVTGITYGRCTSLMAGIRTACAFVEAGMERHVLIVTSDLYRDDAARLQPFALFSDGAAACIVGAVSGQGRSYAIRAIHAQTAPDSFDIDAKISPTMVRMVNSALSQSSQIEMARLAAVLPTNVFQPIAFATEAQGGAHPDVLFLSNIAARGHCFGADPIVNLVDAETDGLFTPGSALLFGATVPGQRICAIAEAL